MQTHLPLLRPCRGASIPLKREVRRDFVKFYVHTIMRQLISSTPNKKIEYFYIEFASSLCYHYRVCGKINFAVCPRYTREADDKAILPLPTPRQYAIFE
jgi:hypothetical protein